MSAKRAGKAVSLLGLIQVAAFFTFGFSIVTVFNDLHRYLELFSHFRLQYLFAALVFVLLFLVLKHYKSAAVMAVIMGLNAFYVLPWYFAAENDNRSEYLADIKVMHSNVYSENTNYQAFIDLVLEESPDILVIQEVNTGWAAQLQALEKLLYYNHVVPQDDNFGMAIYSKYPFDTLQETYWGPYDILGFVVTITVLDQQISLLSTHTIPPVSNEGYDSRNAQLYELIEAAKQAQNPLIIVGDFNITMWSKDYEHLLADNNLFNARKGFGLLPTWPTQFPFAMIPIDHCLLSSDFTVRNIRVGEDIGSDHLPLIVSLGLKS